MHPSPRRDPFAVAALVGAGTLVGHELGYLADTGTGTGHGYFALLAPLAIVGVAVAVWSVAVSVMQRGAARTPNVATLAAAQSILYIGFEVGERTIGTADSPLLSVPVVLGLVAQPVVAWLAVASLDITAAVIAAATEIVPGTPVAAGTEPVCSNPSPPTSSVRRSAPARAPPLCF